MMKEKNYGLIGTGRLLDIEVYENDKLIDSGMIEDAPDEIKQKMYKNIELVGNKAIYNV